MSGLIVRSRAPLRLGLAGGGTDVSPYSDNFGGCVLNVSIDLYSYCTLELMDQEDAWIEFAALDLALFFKGELVDKFELVGVLKLHKAVYNYVVSQFNGGQPLNIRMTTFSDAPPGSGLGSSSTTVVAMLKAYVELLNLPLGEYDLAYIAYRIERFDCGLSGGRQDQYAATFGGFNFMEFYGNDRVLINPLRIKREVEIEFQSRTLLFYTGISRESAKIIDEQIQSSIDTSSENDSVNAMHEVKQHALDMKERLLKGEIDDIISLMRQSWQSKKRMSSSISNDYIEMISSVAMASGAEAIKVSGAGGGGYMMIFANPLNQLAIKEALTHMGGTFQKFQFTHYGAESWMVK